MEFETLFSPIFIGNMKIGNRIVMSPMTTDYGTIDQEPSERLMAYLEACARGGVGLMTLEVCSVAIDHRYQVHSLSLAEDRFIEMHQKITDMAHRHDVRIQPQITHPGPESLAPFFEGKPGVGPSVNVNPGALQSCRPLELDEIEAIIEQYAAAAVRVKKAGYDGMELHAAHAYMLLGSFLSPLRNARKDDFGGRSLNKRAKLLIDTLSRVRTAVGDDFPITVSLSGYERFSGGREINETQRLAQLLVDAGASAFRISGGTADRLVTSIVAGSDSSNGLNVSAAEAIKQVVDVPVIVVGRIHRPKQAESILSAGQADMIAMGRPFLADPEWPLKAKAGRTEDIRYCISCENCIDSMIDSQNLNCAVNAATGRESSNKITPASKKKHVVVVGAGPAGMEAARVADLRGHKVTLIEAQNRLGGAMLLASTVHTDNEPFYTWQTRQILNSTIKLRLGARADRELLAHLKPDAIVIATGAIVETPTIDGANQSHVYSGAQMRRIIEGQANTNDFSMLPRLLRKPAMLAMRYGASKLTPALIRSATRVWMPLGQRVVILGADLAAIEVAEFLAKRGRKISILETEKRICMEVGPKRLTEHMNRLDSLGITINTEVSYKTIKKNTISYITAQGIERSIPADTVIIAGIPSASTHLYDQVKDLAEDVRAIGDCTGLGLIRKATEDGMAAACSL